jgi:hypothetical protein
MVLDAFENLNWLAVLLAGLAYFVLGAIWYSNLLFGRQYRAAIGAGEEPATPPVVSLIVNLVGWLVAALAMGLIATAIGADGFADGAVLGLVVWLGFVLTTQVVNDFYQGINADLAKINGPYNLLGFVIMGVILAMM